MPAATPHRNAPSGSWLSSRRVDSHTGCTGSPDERSLTTSQAVWKAPGMRDRQPVLYETAHQRRGQGDAERAASECRARWGSPSLILSAVGPKSEAAPGAALPGKSSAQAECNRFPKTVCRRFESSRGHRWSERSQASCSPRPSPADHARAILSSAGTRGPPQASKYVTIITKLVLQATPTEEAPDQHTCQRDDFVVGAPLWREARAPA
jgi:hypothetical protein